MDAIGNMRFPSLNGLQDRAYEEYCGEYTIPTFWNIFKIADTACKKVFETNHKNNHDHHHDIICQS